MELIERVQSIFEGAYEIDRELAGGGMSRLFIATDRELQRKVVIKILPPELTSEMMAARFKRESEVTARLQHPHILPVISAGVRDGLLFYVMPFIEGESLRERMKRERQLPIRDAVRLLREVADALSYAHKLGVIHRDIKPENILIQDGHAVLADFGIAAALSGTENESPAERLTRTGMSLGTVGYMAPEQSLGERNVDGRADIYSLGVVGHEMFAGDPPFMGATTQAVMAAHLTREPVRLDDIRDDVPDNVVLAIRRALKKEPGERYQTAGEFRDELELPESTSINFTRAFRLKKIRKHRRRLMFGLPIALVAVIGVFFGYRAWTARVTPQETVTVVIAPFDALVSDTSELKLWHEGMVDLMARNLDGAGPLRTVSPAAAIRGWTGRSERRTALALGRRMNARYVIFGNLGGTGIDSVRIRATLLNAVTDEIINEYEPRAEDVDKAASILTIAILKDLGENHRIGAVRTTSIGSSSLAALKAFLQGEQYFRRTSWDSAAVSYGRAISLDSTFALALRRASQVRSWQKSESDSIASSYSLRAGARNHGLAPRDSLLLAVDSVMSALEQTDFTYPEWAKVRRLFTIANEVTRKYPDDPEAWYVLGEARMHYGYGSIVDISERQVLEAFDRAIALDSAFTPAYIHTIELGFTLDGAERGRKYIRDYLAFNPTGKDREALELLDRMTAPGGGTSREVQAVLDTASSLVLFHAWVPVSRWADTAETALRLLRAVERRPRSSPSFVDDSVQLSSALPVQLAYRGRFREALDLLGNRPSRMFAQMVLLGLVPQETAQAVFARWLAEDRPEIHTALPWWTSIRDTGSIERLRKVYDSRSQKGTAQQRAIAAYNARAAGAYLLLARKDTAAAARAFAANPDTICLRCDYDHLQAALVFAATGRPDSADKLLRQRIYSAVTPMEITMAFERARVAASRRQLKAARDASGFVVAAWRQGDPEVQPVVTAAKQLFTGSAGVSK